MSLDFWLGQLQFQHLLRIASTIILILSFLAPGWGTLGFPRAGGGYRIGVYIGVVGGVVGPFLLGRLFSRANENHG
ncbi:MAG: hypothetical protein MUQ10_04230 [Anaerolineae bacterium]|nr:hypothetical protein [Anaerolineae bacterium]